ncbi:PilZ domain-containing protein [Lichenibacterium dinghuense]|uniref:PilZ domain-containing protein n=1 Tax=Lichenibacterium dinghuense TaxID=2895977 RepID=UPI001F1D0E7F|nr:PilZ domain-containing protein [Lichenibacterium sp. 6Y81]
MSSNERRGSPRYSVSCLAELASGEAVAPARIGDVSDTGCRVLILDRSEHLPDRFGDTGLLSIRPLGRDGCGVVVPVLLRHVQVDSGALHYGLEFRPMSLRQASRLAAVVADLIAGRAPAQIRPAPGPAAGLAAAPA